METNCQPILFLLVFLQLPKMGGLTATRKIRKELKLTEIPIVAMIANATKEDLERCLGAGMNDYLTKPFKPGVLYEMLNKWLPH